jgi:hypothetical protein
LLVKSETRYLIVIASIAVALLAATVVLSVFLVKVQDEMSNLAITQVGICTTKSCIKAADSILNNIDMTVDPCKASQNQVKI